MGLTYKIINVNGPVLKKIIITGRHRTNIYCQSSLYTAAKHLVAGTMDLEGFTRVLTRYFQRGIIDDELRDRLSSLASKLNSKKFGPDWSKISCNVFLREVMPKFLMDDEDTVTLEFLTKTKRCRHCSFLPSLCYCPKF